jgi:hypothetical protein
MIMLAVPALLAACGSAGDGGNESSAPAPAANAAASAPAGESEAAGLARFRAEWLPACIGGARDAAPAGAPVERHCECAIDRMMEGRALAFLEEERDSGDYGARFQAHMRACIREIPA